MGDRLKTTNTVAQVSKPAVSPISKSADRPSAEDLRVWKPTIQQTGKSALRGQCRDAPIRTIAFYGSQTTRQYCSALEIVFVTLVTAPFEVLVETGIQFTKFADS